MGNLEGHGWLVLGLCTGGGIWQEPCGVPGMRGPVSGRDQGMANPAEQDTVAVGATAEETWKSRWHFLSVRFAGARAGQSQCPL